MLRSHLREFRERANLAAWRILLRLPEDVIPKRWRSRRASYSWYINELRTPQQWGIPSQEDTIPPDGERIRIPAIVAVEFYTPSHARALGDGLTRLGIERWSFNEGPVAEVVRSHRESLGGSSANLGVLVRKGHGALGSHIVRTDLPDGIEAIFLWSIQLTPSITAVAASCVVAESLSRSLEAVAKRTDFRPRGAIRPTFWSVDPPSNVKRAAIRAQRDAVRGVATEWLGRNLPGAFASASHTSIPTLQVVVLDQGHPFADELPNEFLGYIGLGRDPLVLRSNHLPGWGLAFDRENRHHATLGGRREDVLDDEDTKHSSEGWYLAQHIQMSMTDDLVAWSAAQLLAEAQRRLARVRDELPARRSGIRMLRRLTRISGVFLQDSMDTRTVADEFGVLASEMEDAGTRLRMSSEWATDEPGIKWSLNEYVEGNLRVRSSVLAANEQRLRDAIETETNIISAIANLWAQLLLGSAALAVTVLLAVHPNLHHLFHRLH